jgi:Ca-activated chloride channel family protein
MDSKFGQIARSYANNVILEPHISPNVDLRYAFRISPDTGALKIGDRIPLGDISLDRSLSILFEFLIESVSNENEDLILANGNLQMTIPSLPIPKNVSRFTLSCKTAKDPVIEPPPVILVRAMSRLSLYRLQEQARHDMDEGELEKATQRLKHLSQNLLTQGETELAHTILLEIESIEKTQMLSEAAQKKIKYGTRALIGKLGEEKNL